MSQSGVEKLVERQMRNWELARTQQDSEVAPDAERVFEFVTLSRQSGAGGLTLARALGKQIGWEVYDREILNYMSQNDAVQQKIYELADEHPEGYFESFLKNLGFEGQPPGSDYFRKLISSINAIARTNHAIFVGRGANFVLPAEHGLRIRVIAPEKVRCERRATQVGCSLEEAGSAVQERDTQREKFLREHFRVDPFCLELYDVHINTGYLSTDAAVSMLIAGLESKTHVHVNRAE